MWRCMHLVLPVGPRWVEIIPTRGDVALEVRKVPCRNGRVWIVPACCGDVCTVLVGIPLCNQLKQTYIKII